jgi:hypothetical protein
MYLRVVSFAFLELLEGASHNEVVVSPTYRNFQRKMFDYICVVMKHPTTLHVP